MARLFLLLHYLLFCPLAASAFDVTSILSQFSEFSTFTYLLARTRLAGEINTRKGGVTVLAVQNGGLPIAAMSDQPDDVLKKILSLHVVLDYLDATRIRRMSTHTAILTTLFQASGRASGLDGFLNITDVDKGGRVAISSAVPGSPPGSYLVRVLVALPQSISVLHISSVIFPPEAGGAWSDAGRAAAESMMPIDASPRMAPIPLLIPPINKGNRWPPAPAPNWAPTSPAMDPPSMGGVPPLATLAPDVEPSATWSNIVMPPGGEFSEPSNTRPTIIPASPAPEDPPTWAPAVPTWSEIAFTPEKTPSKTPFSPSTAPSPASMIGFPSGESPIVAPEQPDMPTWPYISLPPDASQPIPSTVGEEAPPSVSPHIAPTQPTRPHIGMPPRTLRVIQLAPGMAPAMPTWPSNGMPPGGSIVMGPTGPPSPLTPDIPPLREPGMGPTSPQRPAMAPLQPLWPPTMAPSPFRWSFQRSPPGEAPARSPRMEPTESPSSSSSLPPGAGPPRKPPRMGPASSPVAPPRVPETEPVSPELPSGIIRPPPSLTPSTSRRLITKPPFEAMSSETNPTSTTLDPTSPPGTSVPQGESRGVAGMTSVAMAILALLLGALCL